MKKLAVFLLLMIQAQSFALTEKKGDENSFLRKTSVTLLQSTQAIRALSERHLDRLIEARPELIQHSCADVKDIVSQFSGRLVTIKDDFKSGPFQFNSSFAKDFESKLKRLEYLTEVSLNKCADPEIAWALDLFREELMATGFLVQTYQGAESI